MLKRLLVVALFLLSPLASAQTVSPSAQQVQLLAPQLLAFAGSSGNFDSLVNGLTQGVPVTLTTVGADGLVQIVTFQPGTPLSAVDAARILETARQNLIVQGIAAPNAQQLATALVGGTLPTLSGTSSITGVLTGAPNTVQVRNEITQATSIGPALTSLNLSAENLQALRTGLAQGTPVTLTGAAGSLPGVTFQPPRRPLNALEVNQALQLASVLLAQQGILNPTPDQIRVALLGGTLAGLNGASTPVQGVLQGSAFNTSTSPPLGTSDSTVLGTSDSAPVGALPAANRAAPPPATLGPVNTTPPPNRVIPDRATPGAAPRGQ